MGTIKIVKIEEDIVDAHLYQVKSMGWINKLYGVRKPASQVGYVTYYGTDYSVVVKVRNKTHAMQLFADAGIEWTY
jgi:hypothetical protein